MFDEEYVEWENATQKCQELGARLPVLSDPETIKIVKKYLDEADFEVFEVINKLLDWETGQENMTAKISFLSNGTEAHEEYGLACSLNMAVA